MTRRTLAQGFLICVLLCPVACSSGQDTQQEAVRDLALPFGLTDLKPGMFAFQLRRERPAAEWLVDSDAYVERFEAGMPVADHIRYSPLCYRFPIPCLTIPLIVFDRSWPSEEGFAGYEELFASVLWSAIELWGTPDYVGVLRREAYPGASALVVGWKGSDFEIRLEAPTLDTVAQLRQSSRSHDLSTSISFLTHPWAEKLRSWGSLDTSCAQGPEGWRTCFPLRPAGDGWNLLVPRGAQ